MSGKPELRYEITMSCGDTDSAAHAWKIGAYRNCSHCDLGRKVTAVRDTQPSKAVDAPAPQPAATVTRDTAYGYASAYGYAAQQLDFIAKDCKLALERAPGQPEEWLREQVRRIGTLAERGIAEASDALKRYGARIEEVETGAGYSQRAMLQSERSGNPESPEE